ncbi:glycosyltransferase family 4 protein [Cellulomonas sp. zg-ZUI222]|uniref:glycosyltransferase family 4 protein n=1 Tax=Cellulomonas TaxID=1707 RepID=UPI001A947454|nr:MULTISPECIES: glycosyltransferase family 1 protein [Cellulomonas]MBO0899869.1 glycosyltransferase family 4 protein [Cellulomonas sp. zg-ZUI22]MBO0921217.1 glycosyltransferase family 4 protein [Cellulomonas wangleii]
MPGTLRVALDATPLLGARTGIGTYVRELVGALGALPDVALTATAFSGRAHRPDDLPASVAFRAARVPARLLRAAWLRTDLPPVEALAGRHDVFHATNFVLPPGRGAGVLTVHDLTYVRYPELVAPASRAYATLVPRGLRRARLVLTPSQAVAAEVVEEYRLDPDRVRATPLGVASAWFDAAPLTPARRRELGVGERYVVFVGTREPRKDLGTLLAAHAAHRAAGGDLQLVLVGAAGWGEELAGRHGVRVLGHLPGADVRALVAGARALAMPSRYEGFGLPVLEAQAAGTAVLCSDLPVLREVGGSTATYLPVGDVDAWSAALDGCGATAPDVDAARTARTRAATFTWAACARLTLAAYRDATAA